MANKSVENKKTKQFVEKDDWWNEISGSHKAAINEAIAEADKGKIIKHTEMKKHYSKWLQNIYTPEVSDTTDKEPIG